MSSLVPPAEPNASPVAASSSSSTPMSQCSANLVQPMPMIATRSFIPCEAMSDLPFCGLGRGAGGPDRACLPEIVVDAVGREQPTEGHLDPAADPDLPLVGVGQ